MILKAFSLLDTKTGIFSTPFFLSHVGQAIRTCTDLGQDRTTTVGRYPSDYSLCEVGSWDDQTAVLERGNLVNHGTVASFLPAPTAAMPLFDDKHPSDVGSR